MPALPQHAGGVGPKALDAAVLRIRDGRGEPVGLGFLISDTLALTCAHVVSAALGTSEDVVPTASDMVHVDLPLAPASTDGMPVPDTTAGVEHWVPPRPYGVMHSGGADVAVLRLHAPLPGGGPIRLVEAEDLWEHRVRAFGLPAGRSGGVWHAGVLRARQADGWVQADLAGHGYPVSRGFSGTPVWDERLVGVIGMVAVAESGQPPVSYLIPTSGLLTAWPELRAMALPPSPFRGLSPFQESDAALFHGRRAESEEVARALAAERWVTVVGPSGSGKSSLALAGVVPRLRADGAVAAVLRLASGNSPLSALAASLVPLIEPDLPEAERLARIPELAALLRRHGLADVVARLLELHRSSRLLVVVDQFEELLGLEPAYVDELADVLFDDALPDTIRVLITLRADFLEPVLARQRLGPVVGGHLHTLGPLGPGRLRDAVTVPVESVPGVRYEPHLVDRILADAGSEPGELPLLGLTLDLLWERQEGGLLTHRTYEELGGVTGALGAHAERVWREYVPSQDEEAAQQLFTRLVRVPPGAPAPTRRMALRTELSTEQWQIAQRLAGTRLLVTGRSAEGTETVELAHEALIGEWGRLAEWTAQDRSFLVWRASLQHDMDRWEQGERSPGLLPTAVQLANAEGWLGERGGELSEAERHYLNMGRAHRSARLRRRRAQLSGLGLVLVLVLMSSTLFFFTRQESREREALAMSRALAQTAQDETSTEPALGVMLSLAAYRTAPTQEASNQVLRQYLRYQEYDRILSGTLGTVRAFDTSRDGGVVLATSELGRATLFVHAAGGQVRSAQVPSTGQVLFVMVSADGKRAAYLQEDGHAAWFEVDADADRPLGRVRKLPVAPGLGTGWSDSVHPSMSLDGRKIAARVGGRLVWWDLDSATLGGDVPTPGIISDLWFGPDGRTLLAPVYENLSGLGEPDTKSLLTVDMATGRTREIVSGAEEILVSGDRQAAVACQVKGNATVVSLHRTSDGALRRRPYREPAPASGTAMCGLQAVDVSGRRVALSGGLRVVDLTRNEVISRFALPETSQHALTNPRLVESHGKLYYACWDNSLIAFLELPLHDQTVKTSQRRLTADGKKTVSILEDGSRLQLRPALKHPERILAEVPRRKPYWVPEYNDVLALDGTGRLVADREGRNVVVIRDASTLRRTGTVTTAQPPETPGGTQPIQDFGASGSLSPFRPKYTFRHFFDHTGNLLTVSGSVVQQWDPHTGKQLARFDAGALRPRGTPEAQVMIGRYPARNKVSVIVLGKPGIRIVDITNGRTTDRLETPDDAQAVQFDRTGRYFALMRSDPAIELWRRGDPPRQELGPLRRAAGNGVTPYYAGFLDDGRYLIAADNTLRTYRIGERGYADRYVFGEPSGSSSGSGYSFVDVSKDGRVVLQGDSTSGGGSLVLDPAQWRRKLCDVIGHRAFTSDELDSLPVDVGPRQVCPGE
ncbi:nSTAND1 domain-containing NTPase [Streptomyces lydicus]